MSIPTPICTGCNKLPRELEEYASIAKAESMTPDEFVIRNEGTYNKENGHFLCTDCYIGAGMPTDPQGWVAP